MVHAIQPPSIHRNTSSEPEQEPFTAHVGPLLSVVITGAMAMVVKWRDATRTRMHATRKATAGDLLNVVLAVEWSGLMALYQPQMDSDTVQDVWIPVGPVAFCRSKVEGRYVYTCHDFDGCSALKLDRPDDRGINDWCRDLIGYTPHEWHRAEEARKRSEERRVRLLAFDLETIPF